MNTPTPERWHQIKTLFEAALELAPAERRRCVDLHCGDDQELRAEVITLLEQHEVTSGLLDSSPVKPADTRHAASRVIDLDMSHLQSGAQWVGRYELMELIGRGGMGVVYRARQGHPERVIALKLIRPGFVTPAAQRRFEHEAQVLARLQHAGIAQIFDAGTLDTSLGPQPFVAMELVEGQSLTAFAAARSLDLRRRIELMIKVCDGVQHAHQKAVIHRDLKPSNILVSDDSAPKILDFGIARLTDADHASTQYTTTGQILGTIAYMSPERLGSDVEAVDTRIDVYALGVIGYELLGGRLPFDIADKSPAEAIRTVYAQEPPRLGTINAGCRGDLETIIAKAMDKDRERRYASAAELAADLQRFLDNQPILARAPSAMYQFGKYARRNKGLMAGLAAALVILTIGVITTSMGWARAAAHHAAADTARHDAENLVSFFEGIFALAKPDALGPDAHMIAAIDHAEASLDALENPLTQALFRHTLGVINRTLGRYPEAQPLLEAAASARAALLSDVDPRTIESRSQLGILYSQQGKLADAEALLRSTLDDCLVGLPRDHALTLSVMNSLMIVYSKHGEHAKVEPLRRSLLETSERTLGKYDPTTILHMVNLARTLKELYQSDEAEQLLQEAVARYEQIGDGETQACLAALNNLAAHYVYLNRLDDAEAVFVRVRETQIRQLGENHPDTLSTSNNLAVFYDQKGEHQEAEALIRQVLAQRLALFGPNHRQVIISQRVLAEIRMHQNQPQEALDVSTTALEAMAFADLKQDQPLTSALRSTRARALLALRRFDEAEQELPAALDMLLKFYKPTHRPCIEVSNALAQLYEQTGRPELAEQARRRMESLNQQEQSAVAAQSAK